MIRYYHILKRHLLIEEPGGGEDEGDVEDHVDHAGPVHRHVGDVIVLPQDRGDDNLQERMIMTVMTTSAFCQGSGQYVIMLLNDHL